MNFNNSQYNLIVRTTKDSRHLQISTDKSDQSLMTQIAIVIFIFIVSLFNLSKSTAQDESTSKYGNTLNAGAGLGYYGYINRSVPFIYIDYELSIAQDFTIAPFIGFYSFRRDYYYGNPNKGYRYYQYSETAIPIGIKGSYYIDKLVNAGSKWDFYISGSIGYVVLNSKWDNDYEGDKNIYRRSNSLYLNAHLGTEYHLSNRLGLFLDLSTGVSTIGLSIHS